MMINNSNDTTKIVSLTVALKTHGNQTLNRVTHNGGMVTIKVTPRTLEVLDPFTHTVIVGRITAMVNLTTSIMIVSAHETHRTQSIHMKHNEHMEQTKTNIMVQDLGNLDNLNFNYNDLRHLTLNVLGHDTRLVRLNQLNISLPRHRRTTHAISTALRRETLIVNDVITVRVRGSLDTRLGKVTLNLRQNIPLLRETVAITTMISELRRDHLKQHESSHVK